MKKLLIGALLLLLVGCASRELPPKDYDWKLCPEQEEQEEKDARPTETPDSG